MFIILCYDVDQKRVSKVMKTAKKYLRHVQRSVFEGEISLRNLSTLKKELSRIIDTESDGIIIYSFGWGGKLNKEKLGKQLKDDLLFL